MFSLPCKKQKSPTPEFYFRGRASGASTLTDGALGTAGSLPDISGSVKAEYWRLDRSKNIKDQVMIMRLHIIFKKSRNILPFILLIFGVYPHREPDLGDKTISTMIMVSSTGTIP
ncbi:MAG: hypothetical protein WC450_12980 [Candidatus Omnitrophota bacterium]|jgi:hypothetical protein